eukprot:COSAG02_NODE_27432_length_609_cov_49.647059_1_plen_108_part_00
MLCVSSCPAELYSPAVWLFGGSLKMYTHLMGAVRLAQSTLTRQAPMVLALLALLAAGSGGGGDVSLDPVLPTRIRWGFFRERGQAQSDTQVRALVRGGRFHNEPAPS